MEKNRISRLDSYFKGGSLEERRVKMPRRKRRQPSRKFKKTPNNKLTANTFKAREVKKEVISNLPSYIPPNESEY